MSVSDKCYVNANEEISALQFPLAICYKIHSFHKLFTPY